MHENFPFPSPHFNFFLFLCVVFVSFRKLIFFALTKREELRVKKNGKKKERNKSFYGQNRRELFSSFQHCNY
jgi:hypothetical protein